MTVYELKNMLDNYDEDAEIVITTGDYAHEIKKVLTGRGIRVFWGKDYKALVLYAPDQVGAIWDEDEIDLEDDE